MKKQMKHNLRKVCSILLVVALFVSLSSVQTGQAAKKPKLNKTKLSLKAGKSFQLKVKNIKKSQIKKTTFTSTKKKVATVSKTGRIKAKKAGKATIRCKLKLKSGKCYILKCRVTVKASGDDEWEEPDEDEDEDEGMEDDVTESPAVSPTASAGVAASMAPAASDAPAESSQIPGENTAAPSQSPSATVEPTAEVTASPQATAVPTDAVTASPQTTAGPTVSAAVSEPPVLTEQPGKTDEPVNSMEPTAAPSATPAPSASVSVEVSDAFELVHEMGLGINLGNTMESCSDYPWFDTSSVTAYETAWNAPVTTREMIQGMKAAGFQTIRIPVAWSNMMSTDGTYTISEEYFDRVETIMNWALAEDMYVIINIHYDSGWWGWFGSPDASLREEAMKKYETMWTQIAARFRNCSDHVIFESANEELGDRLNDALDSNNRIYDTLHSSGDPISGTLTEDECYAKTNEINQKFVDIVRESGGNNATRFLLIAGYDTDIDKTCDSRFQMPTDTVDGHMMISIHYYTPSDYCISEDPENTSWYADTWGTDEEISALRSKLSSMKLRFADKGIPVVIGEYGVVKKKTNRSLFMRTVCEYALANGMCPVLWDAVSDSDYVYNRSTCEISDATDQANFLELAETAKNTEVYQPVQAGASPVWSGTIGNSGWNPTTPVASEAGDNTMLLSQSGAAYTITLVDWSAYTNPVLTLKPDSTSGSVTSLGYKLDTEVNTDNEYWPYIEDPGKLPGTWNLASETTIDLSSLGLSGEQTLYLAFSVDTFEADITMTVSEKQ